MTLAPSRLEYGYAFDLAASWLTASRPSHGRAPLLAVVSTPEFVDHIGARSDGPIAFACDDERTADHARRLLAGGALPADVAARCRVLAPVETAEPDGGAFAGAVWAAPQPDTWPAKLGAIARALDPGGALCILSGTPISRLTRPLRVGWQDGEPAALARRLRSHLAGAGWQVTRSRALGGLASLGWAVGGRIAARAGRADLADRTERAHHRAVESGLGASYVVLLATRRAAP